MNAMAEMKPAQKPNTRPLALLVSHGAPSAPAGQEAWLAGVAAAVAARLPGWDVRSATLADPNALGRSAVAVAGRPVAVFPQFMSDGWFVSTHLPERLAEAGFSRATVCTPLGLLPGLAGLCLQRARAAAMAAGMDLPETRLLIAAHGSPSDPRPASATRRVAEAIAETGTFAGVHLGFVDEAPEIAEAARLDGPALCLPFFAAKAGHVTGDLPEALAKAGFAGPVLEPIGTDPEVPAMIAAALRRESAERAI